ncbi:uncharacterized protein BDCG_00771 [Blastomyces dermatitidis ER-3]|uniref:Uncharacterized protein n=1 Tax=Ajellomyces dermatitidis (strain ER-3 / ATCC MYA-2586) TaxID=559297 RepID=A0ABP2EL68_AJEDR|nr:uncharacterized protein BDCG_00771 [Blastomyces dermatitidis ER-3]EEQ83966.1 hypothetical protein BDCG_00771 [Blastomyces dermatitidis ER-3]
METNNSAAPANTNGQLTSPQLHSDSSSFPTPGKRKRVLSPNQESPKGDGISDPTVTSRRELLDQTLKDLLRVLEKYDSDLGILKIPLPLNYAVEPDPKRAKLSNATNNSQTIECKIEEGQYKSIQEVIDDVETASGLVIERRRESEANANKSDHSRSSTELVNLSRIFRKHLDNFILRSPLQGTALVKAESQELQKTEPRNRDNSRRAYDREDKMVLTLYGNAPRGRHLFSSLQHSIAEQPDSRDQGKPPGAGVRATINEAALPNGITISKVIPFNVKIAESDKAKARTIADVFPARPTLPQLQPPLKPRSSKNSTITWLDPYELTIAANYSPNEKRGYSYLSLPSGDWLHYGYEPSLRPGNRRPKSDTNIGRNLSKPFQHSLDDGNAKFRGLYSSFAPSFDSSGAVVPEDAKEQIWWDKHGQYRLHALLSVGNDMTAEETDSKTTNLQIEPLDESSLEEAVKSFDPEDDNVLIEPQKSADGGNDDKDLEEVLENISDLLRTLNSYRHIRNLGQTHPVPSGIQNDAVATPSDASSPSATEVTVYETLKSSLIAMIATLPPYAVSKLDGDQLAELNVSKKILLESADYPGMMEEDDYSMQQKQIPRASQMPNVARPPSASNMNPSRPSPYQTPPTAPNASLARGYPSNSRTKTPMGHSSHQAYGTRQPSSSIHYAPSNSPQPYNQPRQSSGQRPGYTQPQFSQPAAPQYNQGNNILQQFQRPTQVGIGPYPSQRMPSPAQAPTQPYPRRASQPPYQQRPQDSPYGSPASVPHTASPQRHSSFGASPQRHPYMNSTPTNPQPRYFQQQTPQPPHFPTFGASQASPAPTGYSNSAAAMTYSRSAAEQAALMDRNKAQLAEHQRQKSSTPQPGLNPQFSGQGNLPPGNRQNGAPVGSAAGTTQ